MTLRRNAILSAAQAVVSGLGLFLIYRTVVAELGLPMLGVWSLVLSTTAFGRMADIGIAGGLARFVAGSLARGQGGEAVLFMRTAFLAVMALMGLVALAAWLPFRWSLALALQGDELSLARALLPWALLTFWTLNLKAVLDAGLMGLHRADLKAMTTMAGMALQVAASLLLVGRFGLFGLAWAQAGQNLLALALSVGLLRRLPALRRAGPVGGWFAPALLRRMLGFGVKLQLGAIANLLLDPASKIVLGAVGGTALLGLYEMAFRMVYQLRSVAIMAQTTLVPAYVDLADRPQALARFFARSCRVSAAAAVGLMGLAALVSPLVGWLWLGRVEPTFIRFTAILAVGWGVNILVSPAYFLGVAAGRVMPNVLGQLMAGLVAPGLAFLLGTGLGGGAAVVGVVAGRLLADLPPAVLNRPVPGWRHAVAARPASYLATAAIAAIGLLAAGASLAWTS